MPLPRPLLQLCALLLIVFAVTAAHAVAPPYGPNEVVITMEATPNARTRHAHETTCAAGGGSLLPMVTNAVYETLYTRMQSSSLTFVLGHMGGSSMQSPSNCNTSTPSLDCMWHWDEGRYAGEGNALIFYQGNLNARELPGATMMSSLVNNYWGVHANPVFYPGSLLQRYGAMERQTGALGWQDNSATTWSYPHYHLTEYYTFCAIDMNPSASPTPSTTTTTTKPSADKSTGLSVGAIVGIAAGGAVAVVVIIALVVCLACNGCCCSAGSTAVADTASQRGDMSRANSFRSRHSGYGDFSNRSFHDGAAGKDGYSRHCSFHGGAGAAEAGVWQNDFEMTSVAGSHYSRVPSQMMMQPQPPTAMHGNWQPVEAPMPVSVYTSEQSGAEMQRRCSNVNPVMCDTDDAHAVTAGSV